MRRYLTLFLLLGFLAVPAWADDDDDRPTTKEKSKKIKEAAAKSDKDKDKDDDEADKKKPKVDPVKKLMEVRLDPFLVPARTLNIALPGRMRTLPDLTEKLAEWAKDDQVGAVLLNLDGLALGMPDVERIRQSLTALRKADKKVMAFLNDGGPMDYLVACAADEIAVAPTGGLTIPGLGRLFPYMRGLYQMQGLEYDVITAGRYKYPGFMNRREPDKYFDEEFNAILDGWFDDYVRMIAEGRKLSPEKVRKAIDVALFDAVEAKNRGLVDELGYYDEYHERLLRRTKFKKGGDASSRFSQITSINDLINAINEEYAEAQKRYAEVGPKIAVLHARGPIIDQDLGSSFNSALIMRDQMVKTIEEIRKNKTIKAVVLAVDSPGGSGYASDVIWKKLRELDAEKPLVVSMGNVAGSGGYYIACPGRLIFAQPTTITGSIGVLAILANQASAINRTDINVAEMKRGARALFGAGHRDMLPEDRDFLQKYLLDFYEIFLDRVAAGRKMPKDEIRKIAEGRIYTGRQALEIGLVDRLGGLDDAIAAVREMASIPASAEIKIVNYPRPSSLGDLAESFLGMSAAVTVLQQSQQPMTAMPFRTQVQVFSASRPRPLCWMAMPDGVETLQSLNAPAVEPWHSLEQQMRVQAANALQP